jgi:acetyltransferase-like isoleucine patch superfamily enzyme
MKWFKRRVRTYLEGVVGNLVNQRVDQKMAFFQELIDAKVNSDGFDNYLKDFINERVRVWGDEEKLHIHPSAQLANTLFNTSSGDIWVGDFSFSGHNVSIITGTHDAKSFSQKRQADFPKSGGDIRIGSGVWLGSNSIILGPCVIEDHAVIGAGCVVTPGTVVPRGAVVVGIPGRVIRILDDIPE